LQVAGSDDRFVLGKHSAEQYADVFAELIEAAGAAGKKVSVTGRIDNYMGRWPEVLRQQPAKPRRILVVGFELRE
jgi:hypothetical protein